jgi:hypothetical protein
MNFDLHHPDAWMQYLFVMLLYSLPALGVSFLHLRVRVFTKKNTLPPLLVIWRHLQFLVVIFTFLLFTAEVTPYLPRFISTPFFEKQFDNPISLESILILFAVLAMVFIERPFIYKKAIEVAEIPDEVSEETSEANTL